ncbi:MAG: protein-L-isoaspartate(D-aspartate) O-methyltransferase [Actinobacteria bacterium]|nr:protein-L-isoaspartate(D-aspartate) O-methyltransferase [Actinomycetota bacterium]MBU1943342.1 protein-L-isoaspartate(D-aspartate) O-methyltransferase [Actinomycetota bacterium]MBU2686540.1 protein-L-isoaspartate(D-aspartate) O-methyltransferase [Actinomycetota bacterium]
MKSDWKETERQAEQRRLMVERQIRARGVRDERVLEAMRTIPRHLFVPPALRPRAYEDSPLPTSEGQTISQPYIVAWMTDLLRLKGEEVVLEVGTGSGYQAAILTRLAAKVYTIERISALAESARTILSELGLDNVEVVVGDGTRGLPEHAPYKGIIVTAGGPRVPDVLVEQLDEGGRLVMPVGPSSLQMLTVVEKRGGRIFTEQKGSCVFVPLIGQHGWE